MSIAILFRKLSVFFLFSGCASSFFLENFVCLLESPSFLIAFGESVSDMEKEFLFELYTEFSLRFDTYGPKAELKVSFI